MNLNGIKDPFEILSFAKTIVTLRKNKHTIIYIEPSDEQFDVGIILENGTTLGGIAATTHNSDTG